MDVTKEALLLAGEAGADPRTAARWLAGKPIKGRALHERLVAAAKKLGFRQGKTLVGSA